MYNSGKQSATNIAYSKLEGYVPSSKQPTNLLTLNFDAYCGGASTKANTVILNQFVFPNLTTSITISKLKIYAGLQMGASDIFSFRLVTGLSQGSSSYTSISTNAISITNDDDQNAHERIVEITDPNSDELTWINNNLQKVINGTDFGIRIYFQRTIPYYIAIELSDSDSKTYIGTNLIREVYKGTTKMSAVYIGTTKVL